MKNYIDCKRTEKELYDFVYRADTHEKIAVAEKWLRAQEWRNIDLFDDLMMALAYQSRELCAIERFGHC